MIRKAKTSMKNKFNAINIKYDFVEYFNKDEIQTEEFCKVITLCHASKSRKKKKTSGFSVIHDYMRFEDETILNFAKKCGWNFVAALKYYQMNAYKVLVHEKIEYFQVLGINYSTSKRERFSIVFYNEPMKPLPHKNISNTATLYIRGSYESMKDIFNL